MQINGKILFYNEQNGTGVAITPNKQKVGFDIQEWDDYEVIPSVGLSISFTLQKNRAKNIQVIQERTKSRRQQTLQSSFPVRKKEENQQQRTAPKCKNKELQKIGDKLNTLLKTSSNTISALNAKISLSMDIAETMHIYFGKINRELQKRAGYKKVNGRLDYILAKRFLWTTFNNLADIDEKIVTPRISSISQDLKFVSNLKDNFDRRVQYPLTAFENIFLSSQVEYTLVKQMTLEITNRLNLLTTKEEKLSFEKEKRKQEILKEKNKEIKEKLTKELKTINGTYVDIVHMMAKLQEIHKMNTKRLTTFEATYKESFYKQFQEEAKKYQNEFYEILDAQAYLLDFLLWKEAKTSEDILDYFHELSIDIELNTKTYLKYYLSTLDEAKANEDTKELFEFYRYLVDHEKNYILVLTSNVHDALDYTNYIQKTDNNLCVKSFISELESIKWAMLHTIKIIIIEDTLLSTTAQKYLDYYHTHIFSKPKIILIGNANSIQSTQYSISSVLPKHIQPKTLTDTLKALL